MSHPVIRPGRHALVLWCQHQQEPVTYLGAAKLPCRRRDAVRVNGSLLFERVVSWNYSVPQWLCCGGDSRTHQMFFRLQTVHRLPL